MSNSTAKGVIRQAVLQTGYVEGRNNNTKFGEAIGANFQSWCASFLWWCGEHAAKDNPIVKSASAAYIQDLTVPQKGGSWVMRKTASNVTKKEGLSHAKFGDIVSFDFGANDLWRDHTAFVLGRSGSCYVTIEGNTSSGSLGSQTNGDCVAIRIRHYTNVCSIVRPKYAPSKKKQPNTPFTGEVPELPARGYFKKGDSGKNVKHLQEALKWATSVKMATDGTFMNVTLWGVIWFQHINGLVPDGEFGPEAMKALNNLIKEHKDDRPAQGETPQKETKREKAVELCYKCAWPKKRKYRKYYKYPRGHAKKAYARLLQKVYGSRKGWRDQTRKGASCDVAAVAILREMFDKKFPRGCDDMPAYFRTDHCKKKWKFLKEKKWRKWKPFTVVYQKYDSGAQHIFIYLGGGYVYNAHYCKKTYPIIEKASKVVKPASGCRIFRVLVPR